MPPNLEIKPIISAIQKIALYETKNKFFIVGSNNNLTKFRVLKIDRTEPYDLVIVDDKVEYSEKEVHQLLYSAIKVKGSAALPKPISAFGIVGFVQFLEGHYLILVTKRRRVAAIGLHVIYKIEDTSLIYIPHEHYRIPNSDEPRYLKMFQSIDLSSNFYFSYSYDITHTFQINNMTPNVTHLLSGNMENELFEAENCPTVPIYGVRCAPNRKFVWNNYLLSKIESIINNEWILYIMHGFISQSNVSIFGRPIYITLIARRSNKYAGTRFLKRGGNYQGDVANEVETEQMVIDVGTSFTEKMRVSSFVQMRGSVPCQWSQDRSQDISKMVAKPIIKFDLSDPYYEIAGAHFNELLRRYGSPIIILNLVKKREKKKHESQLSEQFNSAVNYLNLFVPPKDQIQYVSFDMARMNKGKEAKVMGRLAKIARSSISKTGLFVKNGPQLNEPVIDKVLAENSLQTGVIRVNCVDCLDRTNTAQFALGKCALAYQLYYLGLLDHPSLEFDSDCVRLLEVLYEDHGDTLALQYGGSQLVHRIKTYRKTAPWTSQGNDIMQTLSRYYSNTFSDTEKQHAINLFLGLYVPREHRQPIWEQNTDYYLHHPEAVRHVERKRFPLTQWWDEENINCLPLAYDYVNKQSLTLLPNLSINSEYLDIYIHYHRTDKFSVMGETYEFKISHSIRDFVPQCVTDYSPFTVRIRPGRMREETAKNGSMRNPSLTGKSSTSSNNSSSSSSYESDDEDETHHNISQYFIVEHEPIQEPEPTPQEENIYGISANKFLLKEKDRLIYEKYELIDKLSTRNFVSSEEREVSKALTTNLNQFQCTVPVVSDVSTKIYDTYVRKTSLELMSEDTLQKYKKYVNNELKVFTNLVTVK